MNKLPQDILEKLKDYPAIARSLEPVYGQPSLPEGYEPRLVEVFCDGRLAVQWADGYLTHHAYVYENYRPKTLEWAIDGEMVCVLVEGQILLNRLENPIAMPPLDPHAR